MGLIKDHIEYINDNPEGYWFKRKLFGYGWTPAKPAGWVTVLLYVFFLLGIIWYGENYGLIENSPKTFVTAVFVSTILLITICWKKGEPLKWQWGKSDIKK